MKEALTELRRAAGCFEHVSTYQLPHVMYRPDTDVDERLVRCLAKQSLGEAQEITIDRAAGKDHAPLLIAGIARCQFELFAEAREQIKTMNPKLVRAPLGYLQFKSLYYEAYANAYNGLHLMQDDTRMGEALGFLRYAKLKLDESAEAAKSYRKSLGKRSSRMAADDVTVAPSFTALAEKLKAALDKVEYENKLIHRKEVPTRLPPLIPSKSLINAEPFELPATAAAWHSAEFHEGRVYLKGENDDADKAAAPNDFARIKEGRHVVRRDFADDFCTIS